MATPKAPVSRRPPGRRRAAAPVVDGATVVVGCWLLVFATVADYGVRRGLDAAAGDAVAGAALLALGAAGGAGWVARSTCDAARALVGLWLLLAPLLLDFGFGAESTLATCLDVALGAVVAVSGVGGRLRSG
ncbi:hypothetical protein L6E12_18225 [Actinokineospora sp. PR83]|uniref:hypothetical protein n=1 Tax=Actinokineospora sp. PR83 TaxID=2884908 RepID=UPI001F31A4D6|nr:hypothetical protein [Actinokineospora sp. PR83]MCG8917720.1 hypothetical protein [Actinokineospora sp. PR83]